MSVDELTIRLLEWMGQKGDVTLRIDEEEDTSWLCYWKHNKHHWMGYAPHIGGSVTACLQDAELLNEALAELALVSGQQLEP